MQGRPKSLVDLSTNNWSTFPLVNWFPCQLVNFLTRQLKKEFNNEDIYYGKD